MSDKYEVQEYPINGMLDLHAFKPNEINSLIPEYITECINRNIVEIRIIHGKGKGVLRRGVHAILERDPRVISFEMAKDRSSWGATIVHLTPAL
ncbi:Smr/MutS family protein [Bacteroidota bacterium]|jgi:DNA-nicking Smr family endonuclease|nr:Smr/MutS family protein [Balneolaceae bacterium]MDA0736449.1 Smr/MutS family protein [Bacteroidota bacterium]PDH57039.1 MAG: DNA mismatch repair protein MutS [Rhodothermaeota bacterium MED-G12]MBL6916762.1 Smr/MutS family protein [Balneolaceae bacterium]MDA1125837.1 Smr/MutS family protein [Bacteroidota bacterium]|tara:strand:+ start:7182 stop:7463 length:282 start_codon:yes stop_codon:yes gene_type:complete